jgi:YfiH family protein
MHTADHLQSPKLVAAGFRHAFFTRRGGVSSGPYESLNFSVTVGDTPPNVAENLRRAAAVLGVAANRVVHLSQVHGRNVVVLAEATSAEEVRSREGDALVGCEPSIACGVRTADCVPILIAERHSGIVAAVHAGWRGVALRVVEAALVAMRERSGESASFVAAIGPHISVDAFEVSADVANELAAASPDPNVIELGRGPRPYANLRRIVRAQLASLGLESDAIDDVDGCTMTDRERFFSYRRDGAQSGRHLSAIVPRAK